MSYASDRDRCIAELSKHGWHLADIRKILAKASTAQRLAVAECNGDWPYNGDRDRPHKQTLEGRQLWDACFQACPSCEQSAERSSFRRQMCPDCRNADHIRALVAEVNTPASWNGTPAAFAEYAADVVQPPDLRWHVEVHGDPRGYVVRVKRGPFEDSNDNGVIYIPGRE